MKYLGTVLIAIFCLVVVLAGLGLVQSVSQASWEQSQALINLDLRSKATFSKPRLRKVLNYARHPENKGEFSSWEQKNDIVMFDIKQLYAAADRKSDSSRYAYYTHDSGDGELYFTITFEHWDSKLKKLTIYTIFDENSDGKVDNLSPGQDAREMQKEFNRALAFLPEP